MKDTQKSSSNNNNNKKKTTNTTIYKEISYGHMELCTNVDTHAHSMRYNGIDRQIIIYMVKRVEI